MTGSDDAYFQRRGALTKGWPRNGKGKASKRACREKRAAVEAGAVSIGHDFFLPDFWRG
jgi:hypothetical protein